MHTCAFREHMSRKAQNHALEAMVSDPLTRMHGFIDRTADESCVAPHVCLKYIGQSNPDPEGPAWWRPHLDQLKTQPLRDAYFSHSQPPTPQMTKWEVLLSED